MGHPVISLVLAAGLLLALAAPFLDLSKGMTGTSTLPDDLRSKQGYIALQQNFGFGEDAPAIVVIDGKADSPEIQKSVAQLQDLVQKDPAFSSTWVETHQEADLTVFYAISRGTLSARIQWMQYPTCVITTFPGPLSMHLPASW